MLRGNPGLENSPNTSPIPLRLTNGQLKFGGLPRTLAAVQLNEFLAHQGFQTLAIIRPTQLYPRVAALGVTIFDVAPSLAEHQLEDWQPLIEWVDAA